MGNLCLQHSNASKGHLDHNTKLINLKCQFWILLVPNDNLQNVSFHSHFSWLYDEKD